jgi:type III secretion system FlhB-like substrate exporter
MANIRKTFNFRNGVQVDQTNLLVNSLGLVGIGTSVPTQQLDVIGNVKVS